MDVVGSIRSKRLIDILAQLVGVHGALCYLRSDYGPEFVSRAVLEWLQTERIETAHTDPGKPLQNGADESFNGKLRDECLSLEWFRSRAKARVLIEGWRRHYNGFRPHSSLAYLTPISSSSSISFHPTEPSSRSKRLEKGKAGQRGQDHRYGCIRVHRDGCTRRRMR